MAPPEQLTMSSSAAPDDDVASLPIASVVQTLIADTRSWLEAETHVYTVQARLAAKTAITVLICAAIMLLLALSIIIALVVGALFALMPIIGTGWAILAVVAGCVVVLAAIVLFVRQAVRGVTKRWRRRHG